MEDSLKKGKSQVARGSWKFCNASLAVYAGRIVLSGGSGRRADGKQRRNSAVRAEIRTRGAVDENENDGPAYSGILDPCVHRRGAGGAEQGKRTGNQRGEHTARHAGGSTSGTAPGNP